LKSILRIVPITIEIVYLLKGKLIGWNGTISGNGSVAQNGIYIWTVISKDGQNVKKGRVNLLQ
jgi:hypothetical protein